MNMPIHSWKLPAKGNSDKCIQAMTTIIVMLATREIWLVGEERSKSSIHHKQVSNQATTTSGKNWKLELTV